MTKVVEQKDEKPNNIARASQWGKTTYLSVPGSVYILGGYWLLVTYGVTDIRMQIPIPEWASFFQR